MSRDDDSITAELSSRDLLEVPPDLLTAELPAPLGLYVLLHKIAETPSCQIYLAAATELDGGGGLCVLKRVRQEVAAEAHFEDRFTEAMRRLVHIDHRNVAQVFDTSQVDGDFFIAREYVVGCTLEEVLAAASERNKPLPLDLSLLIAVDALRALYHALRQLGPNGEPLRLWHGRIRPASLLVSSTGEVKLIGFDREWEPTDLDTTEEEVGFVAPELSRGEAGDPRSDVYSAGRLLQHMLGGARGEAADVATIHPALGPLVERATAADPEERPRDVGALLRPLRAALHRINPRCGPPDLQRFLREIVGDTLEQRESLGRFLIESHVKTETARQPRHERPKTRTLLLEQDEAARARAVGRAAAKADPVIGVLPGTKYRILRPIGEGGMGTVYAAEHVDLEKVFALKILHKERRSKGDLDTLRKEARAVGRLGHPNIVSVTDFGETPDGRVFFVMEYLEGESLGELLDSGSVDQDRALEIMIQTCDALAAAHEKGVVHRDIKPDNIFLSRTPQGREEVKLLDFGVAVVEETEEQKPESIAGTPHYMSPELINFQPVDGRSDLYSVGVVAYEALVGYRPFGHGPLIELLRRQIREQPKPLRAVPEGQHVHPAFEAVIMRALAKKPVDRFMTAHDMASELREVQGLLGEEQSAADAAADFMGSGTVQQEIEDTWSAAIEAAQVEPVAPPSRRRRARGIGLWLVAGALIAVATSMLLIVPVALDRRRGDDGGGRASIGPGAIAPDRRGDAGGVESPSDAAAMPAGDGAVSSEDGSGAAAAAVADAAGAAADSSAATTDGGALVEGGDGGRATPPESRSSRSRRHAREGQRLLGRGQVGEAEAEFQRALQLDSRSHVAHAGLGRVAFQRGNYAEAERLARRALERRPGNARYRLDLGAALFRRGRREQAAVLFRQVLDDDPSNRAARRYLEAATRPR